MADDAASTNTTAPDVDMSSASSPDNISLRIVTLAHGASGENDLYLVLNLDTNVGQLKDRLQQDLPQSPGPESQRLIYHGRPLLDNNATLRSILRLQPVATNDPVAHVIHLVIRQDQTHSSLPTASGRSQPVQTPQPTSHRANPLPNVQPPFLGPQPNVAINAAQNIMQTQFNAMQQHLALHNRHLANAFPAIPQVHAGHNVHMHNVAGSQDSEQAAGDHTQPRRPSTTPPTATSNGANTPATPVAVQQPVAHNGMTVRIQETVGPNGERIRTVINSGPFMPHQTPTAHLHHGERPASAPPAEQPTMNRTYEQRQEPRVAAMFPGMPGMPFPTFPPTGRPVAHAPAGPFGLQQAARPPFSSPPPAPTVAWLLSSPTGPQAMLFAPGYGNFSTTPVHEPAQSQIPQSAVSPELPQALRPEQAIQQPPQPGPADNNVANVAQQQLVVHPNGQAQVRIPGQAQPQVQVPPRPQGREGEDLLAFFLQRGWLFLRLYMFIFVLSESGTWRRIGLLSLAIFVCLLPRQNPFTDAFNAARRHVDNLIGPPQPPQRPGQPDQDRAPAQAQGQDQAGQQPAPNANNVATAGEATNAVNQQSGRPQMPTPEEHARRLLREHQAQNPSFIRGLLYSIEQALALFFASLIPGIGERHVRAREDARRIVQEAEERRRRELEQSTQPANAVPDRDRSATTEHTEEKKDEEKVISSESRSSDGVAGTSTAVETTPTTAVTVSGQEPGGGIRHRAGEGSVSASSAANASSVP